MLKSTFPLAIFFLLNVFTVRAQQRPNIVLILADDIVYADLRCFGSEIQTPHLDKMAKEGIKITNFYNASRCCPSRASLLTGLYPHQAGVGDMMNKRPFPAYQGYLNRNSVTLAELLKSAGYGIEGAEVSNTPFKKFKHWEFGGGNATSFIAYGPKFLPQGKQFDRPAHLIDIMPTLAQWSGANYPKNYAGNTIKPMEGASLLPLWNEQQKDMDREICFEHEGNKAVRKGKWKLVSSYPENRWYLYDIENDRSETVDLSASFPKIYREMVEIYENWATRVGVIPYEQLAQKPS